MLVVFVHISNAVAGAQGLLNWLYLGTWGMRVPLFALLAGYFSTAAALSSREARRLIESVLVPYLVIGLLHTGQMWWLNGGVKFFVVQPAWGLWFLLSLFCWRMALPYLAQLRYPLATAVVMALAAGYLRDLDSTFSLSRTLTFLPFFLLGWRLRQGALSETLRATWSRYAAWAVLAVTFTVAWFIRYEVDFNWLRMKGSYTRSPFDEPFGWAVRGLVIAVGFLVALSVLRLIPGRRLPFITSLGAGGLYIYLLHPLVLRMMERGWGYDWVDTVPEQLSLLGIAAALAAVLASPPVRRLTRPLVQPRLPWLFRPPAPVEPTPRVPAQAGPPDEPTRRPLISA